MAILKDGSNLDGRGINSKSRDNAAVIASSIMEVDGVDEDGNGIVAFVDSFCSSALSNVVIPLSSRLTVNESICL